MAAIESRWTKGSTHTMALVDPKLNGAVLSLTGKTITCAIYKPSGTAITGSPFTVVASSATLAEQAVDNSLATEAGTWIVIWKVEISGEPIYSEEQKVECYPNRSV